MRAQLTKNAARVIGDASTSLLGETRDLFKIRQTRVKVFAVAFAVAFADAVGCRMWSALVSRVRGMR